MRLVNRFTCPWPRPARPNHFKGIVFLEEAMTTPVQAIFRISAIDAQDGTLQIIALCCGAGLLVTIALLTYGLDFRSGFFCFPLDSGIDPPAADGLIRRNMKHTRGGRSWYYA